MSDDEKKSPLDKLKWAEPNHDRYRKSRKHEERVAKLLGGRRLPNSGAKQRSRWSKVGRASNVSFRGEEIDSERFESVTLDGDIGQKKLHVEHKRTIHDSIAVKKEWWLKVSDGARSTDTIPALVLTFEGRKGQSDLDLAVVPFSVLQRLGRLDRR